MKVKKINQREPTKVKVPEKKKSSVKDKLKTEKKPKEPKPKKDSKRICRKRYKGYNSVRLVLCQDLAQNKMRSSAS